MVSLKLPVLSVVLSVITSGIFGQQALLFIGDDYTELSLVRDHLRSLMQTAVSRFEIVAPHGYNLSTHLSDAKTRGTRLANLLNATFNNWTGVVLQENSLIQQPGFWPLHSDFITFQSTVLEFVALIEKTGAQTYLFSTWARRDGDLRTPAYYDYPTMQGRVTEGYCRAYFNVLAKSPKAAISVIPVGDAFERVYQADAVGLFRDLYLRGGLNASTAGAYLGGVVMAEHITLLPARTNYLPSGLDAALAAKLRAFGHDIVPCYSATDTPTPAVTEIAFLRPAEIHRAYGCVFVQFDVPTCRGQQSWYGISVDTATKMREAVDFAVITCPTTSSVEWLAQDHHVNSSNPYSAPLPDVSQDWNVLYSYSLGFNRTLVTIVRPESTSDAQDVAFTAAVRSQYTVIQATGSVNPVNRFDLFRPTTVCSGHVGVLDAAVFTLVIGSGLTWTPTVLTPTRTRTVTRTRTRTRTRTTTHTRTRSVTLTTSKTHTRTSTLTRSHTLSRTATLTPTLTRTLTLSPTPLPTFTRTRTYSRTPVPTPTLSPTRSFTSTLSYYRFPYWEVTVGSPVNVPSPRLFAQNIKLVESHCRDCGSVSSASCSSGVATSTVTVASGVGATEIVVTPASSGWVIVCSQVGNAMTLLRPSPYYALPTYASKFTLTGAIQPVTQQRITLDLTGSGLTDSDELILIPVAETVFVPASLSSPSVLVPASPVVCDITTLFSVRIPLVSRLAGLTNRSATQLRFQSDDHNLLAGRYYPCHKSALWVKGHGSEWQRVGSGTNAATVRILGVASSHNVNPTLDSSNLPFTAVILGDGLSTNDAVYLVTVSTLCSSVAITARKLTLSSAGRYVSARISTEDFPTNGTYHFCYRSSAVPEDSESLYTFNVSNNIVYGDASAPPTFILSSTIPNVPSLAPTPRNTSEIIAIIIPIFAFLCCVLTCCVGAMVLYQLWKMNRERPRSRSRRSTFEYAEEYVDDDNDVGMYSPTRDKLWPSPGYRRRDHGLAGF